MDNREEVRQFLTSRRARITPQRAGLSVYGANRRVKGLRREEAALLAGVSVEYYARVERGHLAGVSETVLEAIARALQLTEAEHAHLMDLARTANRPAAGRAVRRRAATRVRPGVQRLLETITDGAAFVRNGRMDVVAANPLGRAFYCPVFDDPANRANLARFCFLDPRAADFYDDWPDAAEVTAAILRTEAGADPHNRQLTELVGELSTLSTEFRTRWAAHNVRLHYTGTKRFHHPVVGEVAIEYEAMPLPADPGLTLTVYSAQPGTASQDALKLLASWAATAEAADTAEPADATPQDRAGRREGA